MLELKFNDKANRLELIDLAQQQCKPFYIDFTSGKQAYRIKQGIGRKHALARAVGIKKDFSPIVLDATAGLGRDAFMLAYCGCQVSLLERNEMLYKLLQDAIQRAAVTDLQNVVQRMTLQHISAQDYLQQLTISPDVIYLDPMFPERNKTALVKQEMRIVRALVGDDADIKQLFAMALVKAKQRVVVKRHRLAKPIAGHKPSHEIIGKTTRYDVYLR